MSTDLPAALRPRSDPRTVPHGKVYALALRFNGRRRGLAAFDWVAVWHGGAGPGSRGFPLEAHGFAEALRGAAVTIQMETGIVVSPDDLEVAESKVRRVNKYLRALWLRDAEQAALRPPAAAAPGAGPADQLAAPGAAASPPHKHPAETL